MPKIQTSDLINDIPTNIQYGNLNTENHHESINSYKKVGEEHSHTYELTINDIESTPNNQNIKREKMHEIPEKRSYGNYICLFYLNNDPLIVIGPDWGYYLFLSCLTFSSFYFILIQNKNKYEFYIWLIGVAIYITHFVSYTLAAFKNPGIPSNNYYKDYLSDPQKNNDKYDICSVCESLTNVQAMKITYHCYCCDICIEDYDHHCPWTSKCVGGGNLLPFYVFVASTLFYVLYLLFAFLQLK
jgi:hypothetical protein